MTTDYPDSLPVRMFVHDADVRREMAVAFLDRRVARRTTRCSRRCSSCATSSRGCSATRLGVYDAEVKMIETGPAIPEFIDRIADAALGAGGATAQVLLDRMREDDPEPRPSTRADSSTTRSWSARSSTTSTPSWCAPTSPSPQVRQGLLDVTGRLFGLRYEPVPDAPVWHEDVTAYDVLPTDGDEPIGRIYLDLHPREGKYKHAAQFTSSAASAGASCPRARWCATSPAG